MKSFLSVLLFISLSISLSFATEDDYVHFYDHVVYRAKLTNQEQISIIDALNPDVWSEQLVIGDNDIMLHSSQEEVLKKMGIYYEVLIPNVEERIQAERDQIASASNETAADFFDAYHNLTALYKFYEDLAKAHPTLATFIPSVGTSIEGRTIPAITIGKASHAKKIYFQGGQHAREWINHATVAYLVNQLLTLYGTNPTVKNLVDNIQFVVVPVVNPDGYEFTWKSNRLWRKNRRANSGGTFGVDTNRNWDDHWGGKGSSGTPSSDTYRGTAPFSEPETKAVSDFILKSGPFKFACDYHSYSQLILRPSGWTTTPPPNEATAKLVGDGIRAAFLSVPGGKAYTSEASWELYATDGTASDWFYGNTKSSVPLSYTIELRDTGAYGFQLPPDQIKPTGEENWAGLLYYSDYVLKNN